MAPMLWHRQNTRCYDRGMKTEKPAPNPNDVDLMEATRRIMGRLAETPHKPHTPIGTLKGSSSEAPGKQKKPKKPRISRP